MAKKKKVRVDMRKNRSKPPRSRQWTRGFQEHGFAEDATLYFLNGIFKGKLGARRLYGGGTGLNGPVHGMLFEHIIAQDVVDGVAPRAYEPTLPKGSFTRNIDREAVDRSTSAQ